MIKKIFCFVVLSIFSFSTLATVSKVPGKPFAARKEVRQFIQEMHKKHGLNKSALTDLFQEFASEKKVLQAITKPYEALPWHHYRNHLVTETRIKEGVTFWKKHASLLKKVEATFGVPAEIIVAILGIESSYGQKAGTFPVLQTLSTLAFDYPPRGRFFREELEHFLLLTYEEKLDPLLIRGSYAGAIGSGQFMPSSYRRYGIDFSGKGKRDLLGDTADIIGSVANYLKSHGWRPNEAIANPIVAPKHTRSSLPKTQDLKPHITLKKLLDQKIQLSNSKIFKDTTQKVKFIELEGLGHTKEYWVGFYNFYVITRYNRSIHYAMAVYQLSQRIRALYQG